MNDPVAHGARAAARQLAPQLPVGARSEVEAALHARAQTREPLQYFDPISLGALIVSAAQLAWTIHKDRSATASAQTVETVADAVRARLAGATLASPELTDRVIDTAVRETLAAAADV